MPASSAPASSVPASFAPASLPEHTWLVHWLARVQGEVLPWVATHVVPLHQSPAAQEPSPIASFEGHEVRHDAVAPHTYGAQLDVVVGRRFGI